MLWVPLWVLERSVCVWAAVVVRARGGVSYAGSRLRTAGHSRTALHRRLCGQYEDSLLVDAGPGRLRGRR
ncbi:hypothetical protein [Kocuria rosea]|uniref:hypothetical protein n=1 Tax=Kocuria rosea TaxID=1275 RepID=UPI000F6E02E1|nr:hypothetical protein [Kocuria rosea]VEI49995.1 Uncharacterised protein [Kocuria rosea]